MPTITPTPPDHDDTLVVPHFQERLLARLHEHQRAGAWAGDRSPGSGDHDHDHDHAHDRHRRSRTRTRLLAAAAVAAVLAGGVAAVRLADDAGPSVDTASHGADDQGEAELQRILDALDAAIGGGSVAHSTRPGGGVPEAWVDLRTGAERAVVPASTGGKTMDWGRYEAPAVGAERPDPAAAVPRRFVDHCLHQYADRSEGDLQVNDLVTPLRDGLAGGRFEVDGTEVVDGRELIRLRPVVDLPTPSGNPEDDAAEATAALGIQQVVYVDPATHLPVRLVESHPGVQFDAETGTIATLPGGPSTTTDIEILPRTAGNLALLVPPVPAGYTQVDQLAQDEVRASGCVS